MNKMVLATTHHDPEERLKELALSVLPCIADLFEQIIIVATPVTPALHPLPENGFLVQDRVSSVGDNYTTAIRNGYESEADIIFYCDFDRLIHWVMYYPEELSVTLERIRSFDMKNKHIFCERSEDAYASHHEALIETEKEPNKIISAKAGFSDVHDFLSGVSFYSKESARAVLNYGPGKDVALYGSWPVAIAKAGIEISFIKTSALSWETPDRYANEVAEAGGLDAWRTLHSSRQEWERRKNMAISYILEI